MEAQKKVEKIEAGKKSGKKWLGAFYITLLIWFLVWITKGWIFTLIVIIPLFNWIRRRWKATK